MAYNTKLWGKVSAALESKGGVEKKFMGAKCIYFKNKPVAGVYENDLIACVGLSMVKKLDRFDGKPASFASKPMKNWVQVGFDSVKLDKALNRFLDAAVEWAGNAAAEEEA